MSTSTKQSHSSSRGHIHKVAVRVKYKFVSNQTYAATIKCNSARHARSNEKSFSYQETSTLKMTKEELKM